MNEIDENQQELDNIYELICSGELINIELAYELLKNYKLDLNNWRQFFVEKAKKGVLYGDVAVKLDKFRNIGSNYKDDYFTNDKALKFYNDKNTTNYGRDTGKIIYSKYSGNVVKIDNSSSQVCLRISISTFNKVVTDLQRWGNNNSISNIKGLENYGNDIIELTRNLGQRNLFQEWYDNNQHEFYAELEKLIRTLWSNVALDWFQKELIQHKLLYNWNNKVGDSLTYKFGSSRIELYNLHSNNTKFSLHYYRGASSSPKITKSRRIDLLIKDYAKYITN